MERKQNDEIAYDGLGEKRFASLISLPFACKTQRVRLKDDN